MMAQHDPNVPLDILFVNLPSVSPALSRIADATSASHLLPPLGILSLANSLQNCPNVANMNCVDFSIFQMEQFRTQEELDDYVSHQLHVAASGRIPHVLAISLMFSAAYGFFQTVCRVAVRCWREATLVVGGVHASNTVWHCLQENPEVDFVVCGEGEEALPQLLEAISGGTQKHIQGVYGRQNLNSGLFIPCESTRPIDNLDIDFTIYPKIINMDIYTKRSSLFSLSKTTLDVNSFSMMASRGCPGRCTFCASHTTHGRKPRWRSLENVAAEIRWLHTKYGVTKLYLMDDNFVPKPCALQLFQTLASIDIPRLEIVIQNMSINHTDHEIIDALVELHCNSIAFAIESGSPAVQKRIKKQVNLGKAFDVVAYARRKGLNVRCFYMIGFPGESVSEMMETFEYAKKLGADWSTFSVAVPLPGTEMYQDFVTRGIIEDDQKSWAATSIRDRVFDTPEIGAKAIKEMAYRMNLDVNFIHNTSMKEGDYANAKNIFSNFVLSFDFHVFAFDCLRRIALATGDEQGAENAKLHMIHLMKTNPKAQPFRTYFDLLGEDIRSFLAATHLG